MTRYAECPQILRDFLNYHETIKGQSQLTISEYHLDLRMFLRFIKLMRCDMPIDTVLDDICIKDIREEYILIFVSGGCSGADMLGERYAVENGFRIERYLAEWTKYGRSAGPKKK